MSEYIPVPYTGTAPDAVTPRTHPDTIATTSGCVRDLRRPATDQRRARCFRSLRPRVKGVIAT